jgi:protein involved in polysaccharide export with SLBB domain
MFSIRHFTAGCLFLAVAQVAGAQGLPTPAQAKALLESNPALVAQLRQEIASSGLTLDQIHAKLRAYGYPEDLLDSYVGPRPQGKDSVATLSLSGNTLDAIASLGIVDSLSPPELRDAVMKRRRNGGTGADTTRVRRDSTLSADSIAVLDSLGLLDLSGGRPMLDSLGRLTMVPRRIPADLRRARETKVDSGFTIFGLNIFSASTTQFDANINGPVDANYKLGPGDRLVLILTGDAERSFTLDVTREGFIVIPGAGELSVANLTLGQLENVLYPVLGRVYSGLRRDAAATTHFSLSVSRLRSNQIIVLGDVEEPGSYRVSSAGTALTALYAAGGPTKNGSLRRVEVRRGGKIVDSLDLYDYLLRGDTSHDPRLQTGDVVFVPVHGARVRVFGEVVRPATYELRAGQTLADALQQAGGFNAEAARRRVQISRILPPTQRDTTDRARVLLDISSDQFATGTGPAYPLEPGDVVRVFAVNERVGRVVTIRGNVWTAGPMGFTPGMHLSDAIRIAGGVKPDVYLPLVLVSRLNPADSTRWQLRSALRDSTGRPSDDLILSDNDEIRIFSVTELRTPEYVHVAGAVHTPGRFAFHAGMTLRDLIALGGGLDTRAYIKEAEIARLPDSRNGGALAVASRVPIDSSYVVRTSTSGMVRGGTPEIVLQPFDNVLILAQPDWDKPRLVVLTGEVRFPGTYSLLNKNERLTDLLARAGGLTASASPEGIAFFRRQDRLGRVGIDLPAVLRDPNDRENLLLQNGDSIHLPAFTSYVDVQGAVNARRLVAYVPGRNLLYYVRAAGGEIAIADIEHAFVTQPNGKVESTVTRTLWTNWYPVPRQGSVVFVPEKDLTPHSSDTLARLGAIAGIVTSIVTIVVLTRH